MNTLQLFNPSNQSGEELKRNFCIRKKEFQRLFKKVKEDSMQGVPQHFIIQGVRGSGKTTILLRLYYDIKQEQTLNTWLIPLIFNEEQYSVNRLFKFWEEVAKELEAESDDYYGLLDKMQDSDAIDTYEEHCYETLFTELKAHKKKVCILIDNIGDFLNKLTKKEQQRLREVLITNNHIRIIGASSEVLESSYKYDEPFYEYFKIIQLRELNKQETNDFLSDLDRISGNDRIKEIKDNSPGRIEALRILTGGVPRTIVLMYEVFIKDSDGESFKQLEQLLDRVTPLYKHRMDDLPVQQQEIVDCVALKWDAISAKEIAKTTRMKSNAVSAQLRLLEKNNVIVKKQTSTKNNLYQIKERFFNIWYIMRNGRKSDRNKVMWLTKFLEIWCDEDSLTDMANNHITKLKSSRVYDKYAYSMSEAYACLLTSAKKQHELLKETKTYLESVESELVKEVSESDAEFFRKRIHPLLEKEKYDEALTYLKQRNSKTGEMETTLAIVYAEKGDYIKSEVCYQSAIQKGVAFALKGIAILYDDYLNDYHKAKEHYKLAIERGVSQTNLRLALLSHVDLEEYSEAEKYYKEAIKENEKEALFCLAVLYHYDLENFEQAERYYKIAVNKGDTNAYFDLAALYHYKIKNYTEAERFYKLSINAGEENTLHSLALLYDQTGQPEKAEKHYTLAIEKGNIKSMYTLASMYFDKGINKKEAERLSTNAYNSTPNFVSHSQKHSKILLWNNNFDTALELAKSLFQGKALFDLDIDEIESLTNMLIAKKQYNFVYNIFAENKHQIKDRLKPVYYALMHFMKDKYPDEILKMGSELEEVVTGIINKILELREKYK